MKFQKFTESLKPEEKTASNGRIDNYHGTGLDIVPFNYELEWKGKKTPMNGWVIVAKGKDSQGPIDIAIHCIGEDGNEINFKKLEDAKAFLDNPEVELESNMREIILRLPEKVDIDESLTEDFDDDDWTFDLDDDEEVSTDTPNTIVVEQPKAYTGLGNAIRDLISAKNSYIGQLNQFIVDLDAYEPNPQVAAVINNIINDNNNEVGQLQMLLSTYSSGTSEMVQGMKETAEQLTDVCSDDLDQDDFAGLQAFVQNADLDKMRNF